MKTSRLAGLMGAFLLPALLLAQERPDVPPPPAPGGDHPAERIESLRRVRLVEILDLKEDQSVRFLARMNEHENARRNLMKERGDALDRLERLIRNNAEEAEYQKAFADIAAVDERMSAERKNYFTGLSDILTSVQRAKMMIFERRFERELRDAMREAQRRRRGDQPPQ